MFVETWADVKGISFIWKKQNPPDLAILGDWRDSEGRTKQGKGTPGSLRLQAQTSVVFTRQTHQPLGKQDPEGQLCVIHCHHFTLLKPGAPWRWRLYHTPLCTTVQGTSEVLTTHLQEESTSSHPRMFMCKHIPVYRWNPHEAPFLSFSPQSYWVILFKMCFFSFTCPYIYLTSLYSCQKHLFTSWKFGLVTVADRESINVQLLTSRIGFFKYTAWILKLPLTYQDPDWVDFTTEITLSKR